MNAVLQATHAAPAPNISTALALVRLERVTMKTMVAKRTTAIRDEALSTALHKITGTDKRRMSTAAIRMRAAR